MPGDNGRRGLCLNCINSPQCTYPLESQRLVTQCEEFNCNGSQAVRMDLELSGLYDLMVSEVPVPRMEPAPGRNGSKGLCDTCNNAPQCTFPRDHSHSVSQCEEFDCGGPV